MVKMVKLVLLVQLGLSVPMVIGTKMVKRPITTHLEPKVTKVTRVTKVKRVTRVTKVKRVTRVTKAMLEAMATTALLPQHLTSTTFLTLRLVASTSGRMASLSSLQLSASATKLRMVSLPFWTKRT